MSDHEYVPDHNDSGREDGWPGLDAWSSDGLTASALPAPPPHPPARPEFIVKFRTPRRVKIFMTLLVVSLIASSVIGLTFSQRGQLWADRSTQLEAELAQANSALETSREDLASARSTLARSEADVAALETRLGELANEKAQAQDDAASANLSATYLYELTQAATATTAQMDVCIQYQDSWSEVLVNIANGYTYNRSELNEFINNMTSTCAKARTMAAYLQDALDAL